MDLRIVRLRRDRFLEERTSCFGVPHPEFDASQRHPHAHIAALVWNACQRALRISRVQLSQKGVGKDRARVRVVAMHAQHFARVGRTAADVPDGDARAGAQT